LILKGNGPELFPQQRQDDGRLEMTAVRSMWGLALEAIGVGTFILVGLIAGFGYIFPSVVVKCDNCHSTMSSDGSFVALQPRSYQAESVDIVINADRWDVGLQFYGDASGVLDHANVLPCDNLKRMARLSATVRPPGGRVVVNYDCRPAPHMVDAGVCVQLPSQQRKEIACLPSLIIFGFQKTGTGELQGWLSAHPALHRWQGNIPQKSGAGEPDYFNTLELSRNALGNSWIEKYLRAGFILTKPSDASRLYTFEKSPK
jgi:hypothetical protein